MKKLSLLSVIALFVTALTHPALASENPDVNSLSARWAEITYSQPKNKHKQLLESLYRDARVQAVTYKDDGDTLGWAGIVTASYAGARGGLGALKLAKEARDYLQRAMEIDPEALNGGARTSLGVLYYQVPPWPVGFGNINRAEKLLAESYEKHPGNLDVLFFYADFLKNQKRFKGARTVFMKAQALPVRSHRVLADTGRQQQIENALSSLNGAKS